MSPRPRLPAWFFGLALLGAGYLLSSAYVLLRSRPESGPSPEVLRVAHRQIDPGMRRAFARVAERYEALHPGVRVEYLDIPPASFLAWLTTQFTGGTAPDIVEVIAEMTNENVARNFRPLGEHVGRPNPYNRGTPHADLPWRDTFVDGLTTAPGFRDVHLEVFGIPTNLVTSRFFYNRSLYRAATGTDEPPASYEELLLRCRQIRAWAEREQRAVFPLAGSHEVYLLLAARTFGQQTQRLALAVGDPLGALRVSPLDAHVWLARTPSALHTPALADSFAILHELAAFMPPGFMGATRADATFHFAQGRTVIMMGRSAFFDSVLREANFDIGVFAFPPPGVDHPRFGGNPAGDLTEIEQNASAALGITRTARDPGRALDFLHFLSSVDVNREFADRSRMLPVIAGVEPHPDLADFSPREGGYPYGLTLTVGDSGGGRATAILTQLHRLFGPEGRPDSFLEAVAPAYHRASRDDLKRSLRDARRNLARQDTLLAALALAPRTEEGAQERRRLELQERTLLQEFATLWAEASLEAP